MYDIYAKQTLYNAFEKENSRVLSRKNDNNLIKKSIFHENANQFLLAFIVGKYDLLFFYNTTNQHEDDYPNDEFSDQSNQLNQSYKSDRFSKFSKFSQINLNKKPNVLIRKFPTIKEHGELRDICFNSSGDNIYILFQEGLIACLSILELTEQFNKTRINVFDLNATLIVTKSICSPTTIIVWYSFDGQQEIAIVGNDLGELCFINIDKKHIIKKTSIKKSIKNLRIIRDKFTVTLLITTTDNSQLKLPLEENRLSLILNQDNDADNIKFMEENRFKLFSCLIVYNAEKQPEIDENKINIKPVPVKIEPRKKPQIMISNSCTLVNSIATNHLQQTSSTNLLSLNSTCSTSLNNNQIDSKLNCILTNQQSFILATYNQENTNLSSINIYEGNEFTYEFITPLSKYCFPKKCVSLENIIELVTERLIITANCNCLFIISKPLSDSRRENVDNSIISSIEFESKILNVFRLNENQIDIFLDTLIVVTSQCAYKLRPKMSCEQFFIEILNSSNQIGNQLTLNQQATNQVNPFNLVKFNTNSNGKLRNLKQSSLTKSNAMTTLNYYSAQEFALMMRLNLKNLFKKATHHFLQNRQYQKVLELFQSESISKLELIKNFISYGFLNEAINIINHLFEEKNHDLDDKDKVSFANVYVACSIQRILEKKVMNEKNKAKLKKFLITNIYYNEQYVIKLLISSYMFELAKLCASVRNNYACLIRNLLNVECVQRELLNNDFYDKINQSIYKDVLIEPFKCKDYFKCLLTDDILQGFFIESELISTYLKLLVETLSKLDSLLLRKAALIFDPRKSQVQIFLNNVVDKLNQKYMSYASLDNDQPNVIQKKDLINFFIFVNLIILKNQNQNTQFDERILGLLSQKNELNGCSLNELDYNQADFDKEKDLYLVSAGQSRGFLLKKGNLFSWGSSKYGADVEVNISCNKQTYEPKLNTYFSNLLGIKIISISSGAHHTLILTKIACYAVGQSIYGQLGCGKQIQYTRYPKLINKLQQQIIQKLVCGQYHSFALTIDGLLYSWGWNIHGQLGHGHTDTLFEPKLVRYFKKKKVVDVSAGYCHSIVLDSDGIVYSFGNNVYGQLGNSESLKKRSLPEPVYLIEEKIDLISSKYFQCLAYCNETKTIYYFGTSPQNNQLMAQKLKKMRSNQQNNDSVQTNNLVLQNNEHHTPRKLNLDFEVKKLETGNLHCMLLSLDGKVYSWGRGPEGQMGHGSEKKSIVSPTLIANLANKNIVDIACGYDFSLCVDSDGELYGFGQNIDHQLGFVSKFEHKTSLNGANNLLDNKKFRIKSKKMLNMLSSKQIEKVPVHIELTAEQINKLNYLDSLTFDFAILKQQKEDNRRKRKTSKIQRLNQSNLEFDNFSLCKIIYKLRHELDLRLILNYCLSLDSYLCCGFIYELLKEPLNALDLYMKSAFSIKNIKLNGKSNNEHLEQQNDDHNSIENEQKNQIKEILSYFIIKFMTNDPVTFKMLIVKFFDISLAKYSVLELETIYIEIYEEKVKNFVFGLFLFELIESENFKIKLSNEFKVNLMKVTCKYLKSAKINEFMVEPALSLLSSISNNQNLLSAEKLWKNILNNIQKELDNKKSSANQIKKNGVDSGPGLRASKSLEEQTDSNYDLNEGIEIIPEDDKFYIFSCKHHFTTDYFSSILLKQLEIINSDLNSLDDKKRSITSGFENKANSSRCPLCL